MHSKEEETKDNHTHQGETKTTTNSVDSPKFKSVAKKLLFVIGVLMVLFLAVSMIEQQFRLSNPDSAYRPSNVLDVVFDYASWCYETIGYYLGYLLDIPELLKKIWRFVKRFFPVEDMTLIAYQLWEIVYVSPFYAAKGFLEYYGKNLTISNIDPIAAMMVIVLLVSATGAVWAASQAPGNPGKINKLPRGTFGEQ